MGAEAIRELLRTSTSTPRRVARETIKTSKGQKQQRAIKRLKVVNAFIKSENKPEWMVLEAIRSSRRSCARWCSSTAAGSRRAT
jgi:DNA-directed RNA polymerase subunit beta'